MGLGSPVVPEVCTTTRGSSLAISTVLENESWAWWVSSKYGRLGLSTSVKGKTSWIDVNVDDCSDKGVSSTLQAVALN